MSLWKNSGSPNLSPEIASGRNGHILGARAAYSREHLDLRARLFLLQAIQLMAGQVQSTELSGQQSGAPETASAATQPELRPEASAYIAQATVRHEQAAPIEAGSPPLEAGKTPSAKETQFAAGMTAERAATLEHLERQVAQNDVQPASEANSPTQPPGQHLTVDQARANVNAARRDDREVQPV